ncbi:MAG: hypothetical protein IID61_14885 [SAR324 cluster bacterium]|nr:hypothetical protein [SAR324 cluster bacterium]
MKANVINFFDNYQTLSGSALINRKVPSTIPTTGTITGTENLRRKDGEPAVPLIGQTDAPHRLRSAIIKLASFLSLEEDWDSYGALPIDIEMINRALSILSNITKESTPLPDIFPTSGGGICFEWNSKQAALEVEIDPNSPISYYFEKGETEEEGEIEGEGLSKVSKYLEEL